VIVAGGDTAARRGRTLTQHKQVWPLAMPLPLYCRVALRIAEIKRVLHLIGTIIIGFLAGVVAKLLTPGRDPGGFIVTTILGIIGAFVATYLGQAVGWYRADEGAGFIGAVVGAIIVLAIYHFIQRRSARS
jgi:uncharacterized membrane protein YeaQ/YmgE (transglycosylase-associated protein family)